MKEGKKKPFQRLELKMKGSYLEKIFTFKIFFQISFFWFAFNSLMSTFEYLYFNAIKNEFITKRNEDLKLINDSITTNLEYLSQNLLKKVN